MREGRGQLKFQGAMNWGGPNYLFKYQGARKVGEGGGLTGGCF